EQATPSAGGRAGPCAAGRRRAYHALGGGVPGGAAPWSGERGMGWQRVRNFLARRLSRGEYLGLHLTLGLLLAGLLVLAFALVARQVDAGGALARFAPALGERLGGRAAPRPD